MARKLACLYYRLIKHGQQYVDKGTAYYEFRYRERQIQSVVKSSKAWASRYPTTQRESVIKVSGEVMKNAIRSEPRPPRKRFFKGAGSDELAANASSGLSECPAGSVAAVCPFGFAVVGRSPRRAPIPANRLRVQKGCYWSAADG